MNRIYVCHTYYHVYIAILKELNIQKKCCYKGTIALSLMSTDFKDLKIRLEKSDIFNEVIELNEVHPSNFEDKFRYDIGKRSWIIKAFIRILFLKYEVKQEEKYINVEFTKYNDIYVFCDGDPIGKYLNYKKIYYHAVEDGLDSIKFGLAEKENSRYFLIKLLFAKLGIIFIKDGYSKYAIDIEVNDSNSIKTNGRIVNEISRNDLINTLNQEEIDKIYKIFYLENSGEIFNNGKENIMILTQPLASFSERIKMYKDIIKEYCVGCNVYIKPHPIDNVNYLTEFKDCIILERYFPVEILNIKCALNIKKVISVYSTSLNQIKFAPEKLNLGISFLDKYEEKSKHSLLT